MCLFLKEIRLREEDKYKFGVSASGANREAASVSSNMQTSGWQTRNTWNDNDAEDFKTELL